MTELLLKAEEKKLKEFDSDLKWFQDNYTKLKKEYKGKYLAIKNKEVVDNDPNAESLINRIKNQYGDAGTFLIEFVSDRKVHYIL